MSPAATTKTIPDSLVRHDETIPPGAYWSRVIPRWSTLRVTDVDGAGAAALLAYNADQPSERYNAPDTTKVQNMIFLTEGWLLLSDMGRVLFSITADTSPGGHETLSGGTTGATVVDKYGTGGSYLERRNGRFTNDRDNFIAALGRHGLDKRDIVPNVNLFARVEIDPTGGLRHVGASAPGAYVDLRAELDVLVALSATPHVLDPSSHYRPGRLRLTVWESAPPAPDDRCRTRTDEAIRAFDNTDAYWTQRRGS
jgi:urea carboxylase-associated protein 2